MSRYGGSVNWFPGHMARATAALETTLRATDVVVEVRDARVPFSSANPLLEELRVARGGSSGALLPRVVVFNKADLANDQLRRRLTAWCAARGTPALFSSATTGGASIGRVLAAVDALPSRARAAGFKVAGATMAVVGVPNVGKSSLINALRAAARLATPRAGAKTGASPGITRAVSTFLVRATPPLYMFDSPGVMLPAIPNVEVGLRLAVTGALPEARVPARVQAEYLLFYFASIGATRFAPALHLSQPYTEDGVEDMLAELARNLHLAAPGGGPDTEAAARVFVRAFQDGRLGRYTLDPVPEPPPTTTPTP